MAPEYDTFLPEYSRFLDSNRHLTYAALSTYRNFHNELSAKEKQFLKNHIDSCSVCSGRLGEVDEVEGEVSSVATDASTWISRPLFRYALAAVLLLAVGTSITVYFTRSPEKPSQQTMAQNIPDPERFIPNVMLESSVGRTVRSGSAFSFVNPRAGDTLAAPYRFTWEGGKPGQGCTLTLVDNKNAEIWKGTTETGSVTYEKSLQPGLYYLRLEVKGGLVQVGKFFVMK